MKTRPKIAIVLGTRPEIIKMSPIIRLLQKTKSPYALIHTGQHYDFSMSQRFFDELELGEAEWKFTRPSRIGSNKHSELVEKMKNDIKAVFEKEKPRVVLVQGDTNSVLAGALAAREAGGIVIGHVEAGLRSYDNNMPEERNRVETDKLSHILFAPTESAKSNLIKENLHQGRRIEVTGNTIVDAIFENLKIAERTRPDKDKFKKGYALVTLHRPESVDNKERLLSVVQALDKLAEKKSLTIIFPVHPRTRQRLDECGIKDRLHFTLVDPMSFLEFLWYEKNADLILTDSGGVQEEACVLKVPCVTIRTTTERPETVEVGANIVAGYEPDAILKAAETMLGSAKNWKNPFGDGRSSERILKIIEKEVP